MIQTLLLIGGDQRALRLKPLLEGEGYTVSTLGLTPGDEKTARVESADALLFPYPCSNRGGLTPTLSGLSIHPEDVLGRAKAGAVLLAGSGLDTGGLPTLFYGDHEAFLQKNAALSAEATVYEAMALLPLALFDQRILVVGYGRYGKELAKRLLLLGARVTVAARREEARQAARASGAETLSFAQLPKAAHAFHLVLNTVPSLVLTEETLARLPKECWLLELSSPPYGFDREAAARLSVQTKFLPALPARYAPQSAALLLKDAVLALLAEVSS